jgi:hypothetical protein
MVFLALFGTKLAPALGKKAADGERKRPRAEFKCSVRTENWWTRWCQLGAKPLCADGAAFQFRNRFLHLRPRKTDRPMPEANERNLPFPHQDFDHAHRRETHPTTKLLFIDEIRHRELNSGSIFRASHNREFPVSTSLACSICSSLGARRNRLSMPAKPSAVASRAAPRYPTFAHPCRGEATPDPYVASAHSRSSDCRSVLGYMSVYYREARRPRGPEGLPLMACT